MSIKKLSFMLLSALSMAALLNGCGSSGKEGSPGGVERVADEGVCIHCHSTTVDHISGTNIVADYGTAAHNVNAVGCEGCHGGGSQHNGVGPFPYPNPLAADRCITCHSAGGIAEPPVGADVSPLFAAAKADPKGFNGAINCAHCHTASGVGSVHGAGQQTSTATTLGNKTCIDCHDIAGPNHGPGLVNDNNGVRAITTEFSKWSHHVTGVTLNAAHCAACHLEGTVVNGKIVVDETKHMSDAKTHLRNADNDSDFAWNPAAPAQADFTGMDNFCMSCHDSDGATSAMSVQIQAFINTNGLAATGKTASASNPFGDTISNRYDKMQRPAVVNAKDQFDPANNSHHAVRGARYSGRTRTAGDPRVITAVNPDSVPGSKLGFALNSTATLQGVRSTIYDAGNFNALYSPLGTDGTDAKGLGDDSTLHCGDCHTVGQWKVGSSDTRLGTPTPAAIGAHGSNNEYLLRNTLGTDQRHTQNAFTLDATNHVTYTNPGGAFLVCYNCHLYTRYGSIYVGTGLNIGAGQQPHAGEYDQAGRCNGVGNTLPFNGYTTGKGTDGTQFESRFMGPISSFSSPAPYAGEQDPDFGNIFGIQCANCHNSGTGNAYGGIHGSKNNQTVPANNTFAGGVISPTNNAALLKALASVKGGAYIDGMGNINKIERFLPGLGNAMHVPGTLGGFNATAGGVTKTYNNYSANTDRTAVTLLPVRDNTVNARPGSYTYQSGFVSKDTNWEQKGWQQIVGTTYKLNGTITGNTPANGVASVGAGCYTLGDVSTANLKIGGNTTASSGPIWGDGSGVAIPETRPVATDVLTLAPSVTGQGGANTTLLGTWGGCDDHGAAQGGGNHGFVKRIVRPITY